MAGGYNTFAKDIWSEGTRYPLLKIIDGGHERRDVVLTMRANNRLEGFIGDLRAQVGGAARRRAAHRHHGSQRRRRGARGGRLDDRRCPSPLLGRDRRVARRRLRGRRLRRLRSVGEPRHPRARRDHGAGRSAHRRLRRFRRPPRDPGLVDVRQHPRLHDRAARVAGRPVDPEERGLLRLHRPARAARFVREPDSGEAGLERHPPPGRRGRRRDRARDGTDPPRPLRAADLQVRQPPADVG